MSEKDDDAAHLQAVIGMAMEQRRDEQNFKLRMLALGGAFLTVGSCFAAAILFGLLGQLELALAFIGAPAAITIFGKVVDSTRRKKGDKNVVRK